MLRSTVIATATTYQCKRVRARYPPLFTLDIPLDEVTYFPHVTIGTSLGFCLPPAREPPQFANFWTRHIDMLCSISRSLLLRFVERVKRLIADNAIARRGALNDERLGVIVEANVDDCLSRLRREIRPDR